MPPRSVRGRALLRKAQVVAGYLVMMAGLVPGARAGWLPEKVFLTLDLVLSMLVLMAPAVLDAQLGPAAIRKGRLTVRTLTGQRVLDLGSLKRVRLFELPSRGGSRATDVLFVTDGRRVRAGLTSAAAIGAVARAVTPRTRVSRHARRRLKREPVTFLRGAAMMAEFFAPYFLLAVGCLALTLAAYGLAFP